jgi:hypothetical protein
MADHREDRAVESLVTALAAGFAGAPWPGVHQEPAAGRNYPFTATEAGAALEAVPLARAWVHLAFLEGGDLVSRSDADCDEVRARRHLLGSALRWCVALHRAEQQRAKAKHASVLSRSNSREQPER